MAYSNARIIPRRIDIIGPREKGVDYIGMANSQLCILENQMSLGVNTLGTRTLRLHDGTVIEAWKDMNMSGVRITTAGGIEPSGREERCFCTCHVATGYIAMYSDHNCPDMTGGWPGRTYPKYYDVLVCEKETEYILIQNVLPMSLSSYQNGQEVLVVFQPATGEPYVPFISQGCDIVTCRVTDILENHPRLYEV